MKTISLTSLAMLSLIAIGAVQADELRIPAVTVKFADLDLSRTAGEAVLYSRISQAARQVCAPFDVSTSVAPGMREARKACLAQAVSGAVSKVNNPNFTAYVSSKDSQSTIKLASR